MSRPAWLGTDGNLSFADITAATAWATANPSLVYDGLLATAGGSAVVWRGGAWVGVVAGESTALWAFGGDSITNGSTAGNFRYSYVSKLAACFPSTLLRVDSLECGLSGSTSEWGRYTSIPTAISAGAKNFTILWGTNDCGAAIEPSVYIANIKAMVAMIRANGGNVIVGTPIPRGAGKSADEVARLYAYRTLILNEAVKSGYEVAYVYEALVDTATGYMAASYDSGDNTHPNALGHAKIFQAFAKAIRARFSTQTLPQIAGKSVSNGVADGVNFASGWYEQPGGTGVAVVSTAVDDTSGILVGGGKWRQWAVNSVGQATSRTLAVSIGARMPVAAGDVLLIVGQIQIKDISGTWESSTSAQTAGVGFRLVVDGSTAYERLYNDQGWYDPISQTWNISINQFVFNVPATTALLLWCGTKTESGGNYEFRFGNIGVYNATALEIPVGAQFNSVVNFL